jgi:hypothetical protein
MARGETFGTPKRSEHYPPLRRKWRLLLPSAIAAGALLFALFASYLAGARRVLSPGSVTSAHAPVGTTCQQCHTRGQGVSNARCQRCHDPAAGGRLANASHVLFGSGDAAKAAAAPDLSCASCHIEHRGARARLGAVDQAQCARCHFRSFPGHPEFAVLRSASVEVPGLQFGHERHIAEVIKKQKVATAAQTCGQCHAKGANRDFDPLSFDRHCAACHSKEGSVGGVDPVPLGDVVDLAGLRAAGVAGAGELRAEDFETSRGKVAKPFVRHRDPWVAFNLALLRGQLDPEGVAGERALLLARQARLERRLAGAAPVAALARADLESRAAGLASELKGAEARLSESAQAVEPAAGLDRLAEVGRALGSDPAAAGELEKAGQAARDGGTGQGPLTREEFAARRDELLALLESVEAADPALKPRVEDLRRRLVALPPGDSPTAVLTRVRDQRKAALDRIQDELRLRAEGVGPPQESLLDAEARAIERSLAEVQAALAQLPASAPAPLAGEEAERKKQTAEVLAASCAKCHVAQGARLLPVRAARPVLARARFLHEPHVLQADCVKCHAGIEKSKVSKDLHLQGVQSCRECHRAMRASQDCQTCHRYHPAAQP